MKQHQHIRPTDSYLQPGARTLLAHHNMYKSKHITAWLGLATLIFSTATSAATFVTSFSVPGFLDVTSDPIFGGGGITGFNAELGDLKSAKLEITVELRGPVIVDASDPLTSYSGPLSFDHYLSLGGLFEDSTDRIKLDLGDVTELSGVNNSFDVSSASGTFSFTEMYFLDGFISDFGVNIHFGSRFELISDPGSGVTLSSFSRPQYSLSGTMTYSYIPSVAVPEPSTSALLTGLSLAGFALWRHRPAK